MTWAVYQDGLAARLQDLHERIHTARYRALPNKRGYLPKEDGSQRKLGIAALEDKIVQHAWVTVLNAIYEVDFMGFSYGYRPGRDPHKALDALWVGLSERPIGWVLDMDIRGFFDCIQHDWLVRFVEHRIADKRIIRLARKWLRAGVLEKGRWEPSNEGSPQGAVASPLLANIYLHYVFDLWAAQWRRRHAKGAMVMVRYVDDIVAGFQHKAEAEQFLREVQARLKDFGLNLHPKKTRLIEFGRFAAANRAKRGKGKPDTFHFLGFTHCCATTRSGCFTIRRQTTAKRFRAKVQSLKHELRSRMHEPVPVTGKWLRSVLLGYYRYFAVPYNLRMLLTFRYLVGWAWWRVLKRRSQKARRRLTWEKFWRIAESWLPAPRVYHPWPNVRFRRPHPRQEPYAVAPHVRICTGGAR